MAGMLGMIIGIGIFICYGLTFRWINRFMEEKYYDRWRAITHFKPHLETSNWLFHRGIHNWQNELISAFATVVFYLFVWFGMLGTFLFVFLSSFHWGNILETLLIGKSF